MFEIVVVAFSIAAVVAAVEWWRGPEIPRR
jgi:hypothetical protein